VDISNTLITKVSKCITLYTLEGFQQPVKFGKIGGKLLLTHCLVMCLLHVGLLAYSKAARLDDIVGLHVNLVPTRYHTLRIEVANECGALWIAFSHVISPIESDQCWTVGETAYAASVIIVI